MTDRRLPVILLTGFLGSGKTTLLNRLLRDRSLGDSVVVVNEFGDIPLDHLLIRHVDEKIRLLDTGCVCCVVRGDLIDTLADLAARRRRGELDFARVFIETSGLVDPTPIFHSMAVDPALVDDWRLSAIVTTVDAVNGPTSLEQHEQARRQVALADVLLLTKRELGEATAVERLAARLTSLNPYARRLAVEDPAVTALLLSDRLQQVGPIAAPPEAGGHSDHDHGSPHDHEHRETIQARSIVFEGPVPQAAILEWIALLAAMRGEQLLRLKGVIQVVEDPDRPRLVQAVQHVVHPVEILERWPSDDRRSRLVLIGEGLDFDTVENTLRRYAAPMAAITAE